MAALLIGLAAALAWGVHDFLVRRVTQHFSVAPLFFVVLLAGALALVPVALAQIMIAGGGMPHFGWTALSGLGYLAGGIGLYKAFEIGPVRLVAPICGAYPALMLLWAGLEGRAYAVADWIAVLAVVAGIALVAREPDTEAQEGSRTLAIAWAAIAALGFAATFILGNRAAAMGGEAMVALAGRLVALAALGAYLIARSAALAPLRPYLGTLILMGILDAGALALVLSAAGFAHPELAAVAASLFGVVTILLAWSFSGERLAPLQWAGVALIFAAVAALGLE